MTTQAMDTGALMSTYKRWPVEFVSGSGARLVDVDGRSYLDFVAGIAVASVGHCHEKVVAAIEEQARTLIHVSNLYYTRQQAVLAARLAEVTGGMHSFFCNSGAEAIEAALKLARKRKGPGSKIVCAEGSFHGRTFGALSATGQPSKQAPFAPLVPGFVFVPYGDAGALASAVDGDVAAVLLEPIQGEAGVVEPPGDYLAAARSLCDESGALLILDEIQTGLARTGALWAHEHVGVRPDVMCIAKALAGGLPMGACLATPEVAGAFVPGDHGSTFGGGPVQSAAALAVLDVIEAEGLVARAAEAGTLLTGSLARIFDGRAVVRGRGLLVGIAFEREVARNVAEAAFARGLLVNDATSNVVRLAPPLVVTDGDIEQALGVLEEVAGEI